MIDKHFGDFIILCDICDEEVVKFRLSKYIYQRKFIDDVERFILGQSNYVEEE